MAPAVQAMQRAAVPKAKERRPQSRRHSSLLMHKQRPCLQGATGGRQRRNSSWHRDRRCATSWEMLLPFLLEAAETEAFQLLPAAAARSLLQLRLLRCLCLISMPKRTQWIYYQKLMVRKQSAALQRCRRVGIVCAIASPPPPPPPDDDSGFGAGEGGAGSGDFDGGEEGKMEA